MEGESHLRRSLGYWQIQLISLGGIIGAGYFLGVGATLAENGAAAILAYALGGLIVWWVAMAMGELSVAMPREGSFVSHAKELLGPSWAAGVGWSYWFNWCAYIPSEMVAGGLILNGFFPSVPAMVWASIFGLSIAAVNLGSVRSFGRIESGLALLKIGAIAAFTAIGGLIWMGWIGSASSPTPPSAGSFPSGGFGFLAAMVLVLVNFQGTELIALSAAETVDPERSIPRAARNVAWRTLLLYVLPLIVLMGIYPWNEANVERSVFSEALARSGFGGLATAFQIMVVTAGLSCANSGLYGSVRSLYGLGKEGLAPAWVTRLNGKGAPALATWLTLGLSASFLPLYVFFEGSEFYTWLLSLSGFTGAICWISISVCQIQLRRLKKHETTGYRMRGYPWLSWLSVGVQGACLAMVALHPTLRSALILGLPAFFLPVVIHWVWSRRRGVRQRAVA